MRKSLTTQSDFVTVSTRLIEALNAHAAELPHFEVFRDQLDSMLEEMREQMAHQDALTASKQVASKRIQAIHEDGIKLVKVLWRMAQQHYGRRNEKLIGFGVQPFRGRSRRAEDTVTPVPTPPPPTVE